jgi:hypothetical protein
VPDLLGILARDMHQGVYSIAPSESTSIIPIDDDIFQDYTTAGPSKNH